MVGCRTFYARIRVRSPSRVQNLYGLLAQLEEALVLETNQYRFESDRDYTKWAGMFQGTASAICNHVVVSSILTRSTFQFNTGVQLNWQELRSPKPSVEGSNPSAPAKNQEMQHNGCATDCLSEGCGFESHHFRFKIMDLQLNGSSNRLLTDRLKVRVLLNPQCFMKGK